MFDNFNVNLHKNKGFLTYIPYIPVPEYGQSNAPINSIFLKKFNTAYLIHMKYEIQLTNIFKTFV